MSIIFSEVDISPLENALASLKSGLAKDKPTELERDGVIQRFEFSFELSWKIIRRCLIAMGRTEMSASPKPILREALREGFIADLELWFTFLNARNAISHTYSEKQAQSVYQVALGFVGELDKLIATLKKYEQSKA